MMLSDEVKRAVFAYSEWLDAQGLMKTPGADDKRSHDDLVREFTEHAAKNGYVLGEKVDAPKETGL